MKKGVDSKNIAQLTKCKVPQSTGIQMKVAIDDGYYHHCAFSKAGQAHMIAGSLSNILVLGHLLTFQK